MNSDCHDASMVTCCDRDKPESFMDQTCDHMLCMVCLRSYIVHEISEGHTTIRCPVGGFACPGIVCYWDIERVDLTLATQFTNMVRHSVSQRDQPELWHDNEWNDDKPVRCPRCGIYIYRNEGCEVIYCMCGFIFCSGCMYMYKGCRCQS